MGQQAVMFPGQGAQQVGMGKDVAERSAAARAVFDQANERLGFDLASLCFDGPAEEIEKTDIQQPAIFVTSVALWRAFVEAGGRADAFAYSGGLSLGEYTALHVAGAVSFEDALRLVRRRGQLMQEAATASPSGMVSLVGADETSAEALCAAVRQDEVLVCANFNCPGQVVISGAKAACERAVEAAGEHKLRAVTLPVAGAFHSPCMEPAAEGLWAVLTETRFSQPRMAVVSNVTGKPHENADSIREGLRRQLTAPVRWQHCVERMIADGVDSFVEVGPGKVLCGLLRKIDRSQKATPVNSAETAAAAATASAQT